VRLNRTAASLRLRVRPIALALLRPARLRRTLTRSAPGTALFHCEPSQHKEVSTLSEKIVVEFAPTSLAARTSTLSPHWFIFSWGDGERLTADFTSARKNLSRSGETTKRYRSGMTFLCQAAQNIPREEPIDLGSVCEIVRRNAQTLREHRAREFLNLTPSLFGQHYFALGYLRLSVREIVQS
jgi:hypothetical protein